MNSARRSITAPSPNCTDQTRPPTRSRASSTVTSAPPARRVSAAARPAKPAPMTTTRCIQTPRLASRRGSSQAGAPSDRLAPTMPGADANKRRAIETEVVVVGGGIAGLTAASELAGAGIDSAVLEARDRVGGRTWNTEIGGEANELGGQWVAPYQSAMHELLADLEIELFPSFRTGEHVYVDPK